MTRSANYSVLLSTPEVILLRDKGPWDQFLTITNDAEGVIQDLVEGKHLKDNSTRVVYFDSEDMLTELLHQDGKFSGFSHANESEFNF